MKYLFTKEQQWLDRWDEFLSRSNRGLYNQLSDWIQSYEVYGFDYKVFLLIENDTIVGGCGIVIAKLSFFKFYIVPSGPVLEKAFENQTDFIIQQLKEDATQMGCCYFQISIPLLQNEPMVYDYSLSHISDDSIYFSGNEGTKFKFVIPLHGYRLVLLEGLTYESVYSTFSKNTKRNIAKAKKEGFTFRFVSTEAEIRAAYSCFEQNAKEKGYPLRSYTSMQTTLSKYINKNLAKMGCCYLDGVLVGALYVMQTGNRLTYINGGVLKAYQKLPVSHFMHNYLIEYSITHGYKSYDISVGGSAGVVQFKEGFGTDLYEFVTTRHWVLRPFIFQMYTLVEQKLKKRKTQVAQLLLKLKKSGR